MALDENLSHGMFSRKDMTRRYCEKHGWTKTVLWQIHRDCVTKKKVQKPKKAKRHSSKVTICGCGRKFVGFAYCGHRRHCKGVALHTKSMDLVVEFRDKETGKAEKPVKVEKGKPIYPSKFPKEVAAKIAASIDSRVKGYHRAVEKIKKEVSRKGRKADRLRLKIGDTEYKLAIMRQNLTALDSEVSKFKSVMRDTEEKAKEFIDGLKAALN